MRATYGYRPGVTTPLALRQRLLRRRRGFFSYRYCLKAPSEPSSQDVARGVHVSVRHISASTAMYAVLQRLGYGGPARRAFLASVTRHNRDHLTSGALSLLMQEFKELRPTLVFAVSPEFALYKCDHIQLLNTDRVITMYKIRSYLVRMVAANVTLVLQVPCKENPGLPTAIGTPLSPRDPSMCHTPRLGRCALGSRPLDQFTVARRGERRDPEVDAHRAAGRWQRLRRNVLKHYRYVPMAVAVCDPCLAEFRSPWDRPVHFHLDVADTLDTEPTGLHNFDATRITAKQKLQRVVTTPGLVTRIAGFLASLDPAKELLHGAVGSSQYRLLGRAISRVVDLARRSRFSQLLDLVVVHDRDPILSVGFTSLLESGVIEAAILIQLAFSRCFLLARQIQSIAIASAQGRLFCVGVGRSHLLTPTISNLAVGVR